MTTLLLIRHADHGHTREPRLAGWLPSEINDNGYRQIGALLTRLESTKVSAIYSSPVLRARQTAAPLAQALGLRVRKCVGVAEVRYGQLTGKSMRALARSKLWKLVQATPSRVQFPGGESIAEVQHRVVRELDQLCRLHPRGTIVVVSHADPIKLAVAHYLGLPLDLYSRLIIDTASVTVLRITPHTATLVRLNDNGAIATP